MSFKESVLIPIEIFKKIQASNLDNKTTKEKILNDITLNTHEKLRLLKREQFKSSHLVPQESQNTNTKVTTDQTTDINIILENVKETVRPNARKALQLILNYPHIIRWDSDYVVYVKNKKN